MHLPSHEYSTSALFTAYDWIVLGVYLLVLACSGYLFAKKEPENTEDYFLGSRSMPPWAVAVSIVATSLSAVTFIGAPEIAYGGDLSYLATNLGMIIASLVIAFYFLPVFYQTQSASIYEFLEHRFGRSSRTAASITFLIGRTFASGARIYVGAIPASILFFGLEQGTDVHNLLIAISILTIVGITYTLFGGIRSVIWSDVIQYAVLIGAALCAIVLILNSLQVPLSEVVQELRVGSTERTSKLTIIDTDFDMTKPFSIWACLVGFTLLGIGSYGTDQDLAQRMLTCRSAKLGARSVIHGILLGIPTVSVFLVVGLLLWVVYQRPEMTSLAPAHAADDSTKIFLQYILTQVPAGVRGLMMAGLFAAGLSSLNSAINAMSAAFISDIYTPLINRQSGKHIDEKRQVYIGRLAVIGWGVVLGLFAIVCIFWKQHNNQSIIDFALGVMGIAYAGLVGVFFCALFTKRGSSASVIAALLVGFAWMILTQPFVFTMGFGWIDSSEPHQLTIAIESFYSIHFTWKLTIGVLLTTSVCMLGQSDSTATPLDA